MEALAGKNTKAGIAGISSLDQLNEVARGLNVTPGWSDRAKPIFRNHDRSAFLPGNWKYSEMCETLDAACGLIGIEMAERRNVVLCNPKPGDDWATTQTLVCAYQMILPEETAPSHRHSANAMRVILDGYGTYSVIDGVKVPMNTGDVMLTPGGCYHGHGHEGDAPAYWFDCLDVPLTRLFETNYQNDHPDKYEKIVQVTEESPFRFSAADIEKALETAPSDPEGRGGKRVKLDTSSMPVHGLVVQRFTSGEQGRRWRSYANRIYLVMSGSGTSVIDGRKIDWKKGDSLVIPANYWLQHSATSDAQLMEISDEPLMRFANHYIEELD